MSNISLRLPDSLHKSVKELAKQDHISINQFIVSSVGEKLSALMAEEYLEQRGQRGSQAKFLQVLSKVPDVAPEAND